MGFVGEAESSVAYRVSSHRSRGIYFYLSPSNVDKWWPCSPDRILPGHIEEVELEDGFTMEQAMAGGTLESP